MTRPLRKGDRVVVLAGKDDTPAGEQGMVICLPPYGGVRVDLDGRGEWGFSRSEIALLVSDEPETPTFTIEDLTDALMAGGMSRVIAERTASGMGTLILGRRVLRDAGLLPEVSA